MRGPARTDVLGRLGEELQACARSVEIRADAVEPHSRLVATPAAAYVELAAPRSLEVR